MPHFPKGFRTFAEYNRFKQHVPWGAVVTGSGPYGIVAPAVAWWKRDTLSGNTNGASISTWGDSSAGGWALAIDTVAPTWDSTTLGGSVLADNATSKAFKSTAFSALANQTAYTIFLVGKASSFTSINTMFGTTGTGVTAVRQSAGSIFFNVGAAGTQAGKYAFTDTASPHVWEVVFDGTQSTDATKLRVLQEGVQQTLTMVGSPLPTTTGAIATGAGVGNTAGASERWSGNIAEIIIVASALSAADRSTVRVALGSKYSISVTP